MSEASPLGKRAGAILPALACALLLNGLLSAENVWPTLLLKPDARLAPEFVLLWSGLLVGYTWRGLPGRRTLNLLAAAYLLLALGRYLDVSVPALFGRPVNLYWDGLQLPRFISVVSQALPGWGLIALAVLAALITYGLFRLFRSAIARLAHDALPWAAGTPAIWLVTALALATVLANLAGVKATWPVISKPITPTYVRQAALLASAWLPGGIDRVLPPSPAFDGGLGALQGASVKLMFLESYGAVVYDDAEIAAAIGPAHRRFEEAISATGRQVASAFYRSPTFAGASDLAHLSLLSGIDLSNPLRHDVLLTSERPTLISHFRRHGYEVIGLYPALSWPWPERRYYGFDQFHDGPALRYQGPKIGLWWIPDQYSIARTEQERLARGAGRPHLLIFPTINTHVPFRPIPPYQADWERILTPRPFDDEPLSAALADEADWTELREPYARAVSYTFEWLKGYLEQPWLGDDLLILIGDHQPLSGVSRPGASWDVPVHVITRDTALLDRFIAEGFKRGMEPERVSQGGMHKLTRHLLRAFDASPGPPPSPRAGSG
ncbi:MAG: hypothetical protein R3E87_15300 [Burkholderiaceae bacterium]